MKKLISIFLTACICITISGCSNSNNTGNSNSTSSGASSNASSDTSAVGEDSSSVSSDSGVKYQPTDEIINADFSSGLVQIGNDLFKNGGYMTVAEICEQVKDKYTYEEKFYDREFSFKNRAVLYLTGVEDEELSIRLEYAAPAKGSDFTVPNAVVMSICPNNEYTSKNTWLPTGIPNLGAADRNDEIVEVFKSKGFTDATSEDFAKDFLGSAYATNAGSYVEKYLDIYTIGAVQLEGENLYGSAPVTAVWLTHLTDSDVSNFFYGNSVAYMQNDRLVYWKSDLR